MDLPRPIPLPAGATDWTAIDGLPGAWRRLRTRVLVSATAADAIAVDGTVIDGLHVLRPDGARLTVRGRPIELVDDGVTIRVPT